MEEQHAVWTICKTRTEPIESDEPKRMVHRTSLNSVRNIGGGFLTFAPSRGRNIFSDVSSKDGCLKYTKHSSLLASRPRDGSASRGKENTKEDMHRGLFTPRSEVKLLALLTDIGTGSSLRGWRRIFDPEGKLEASMQELDDVCHHVGLARHAEISVESANDQAARETVPLKQVFPKAGMFIDAFRQWISDHFGSHSDWYSTLDGESSGRVPRSEFFDSCLARYGQGKHLKSVKGTMQELEEAFCCCDMLENGFITLEDSLFLEPNDAVRDFNFMKLKNAQTWEHDKLWMACYSDDAVRYPIRHRRAIRPWDKHRFEGFPLIARERLVARQHARKQLGFDAYVAFIRHLRNFHGTEMRAWRRAFKGDFEVSHAAFKQHCRHIQFDDDINALVHSLDPGGDGVVAIEKLSARGAAALANFYVWAHQSFGSCLQLMDTPEAAKHRKRGRGDRSFSHNFIGVHDFANLLWCYGYPLLFSKHGDDVLWYLLTTLDFYGNGAISCSDLEWLDHWTPPQWLVARPDEEAWSFVRTCFVSKFGHLLKAWRSELDRDNLNHVSWNAWRDVCKELKIKLRFYAGAWCKLDQKRLGYISVRDFCGEDLQTVSDFKDMAESKFGSLFEAFRAMDFDGGGTLSATEFRNACFKFRCVSDSQFLFTVLSSNGKYISIDDFFFLSNMDFKEDQGSTEFLSITEALWTEALNSRYEKKFIPPETRKSLTSCSQALSIKSSQLVDEPDTPTVQPRPISPYDMRRSPLRPRSSSSLRPRTATSAGSHAMKRSASRA